MPSILFILTCFVSAWAGGAQVTSVDSKPARRAAVAAARREPRPARGGGTARRPPKAPDALKARGVPPAQPTPRPTPTPLQAAVVKSPADWMVSYSPGDSCGVGAVLSVLDSSRGELRPVLALKCVRDFRQNPGAVTNGLPEFVYTGPGQGGGLYLSVFKFDGAAYREESCRVASATDLKVSAPVACDGRGIVQATGLK